MTLHQLFHSESTGDIGLQGQISPLFPASMVTFDVLHTDVLSEIIRIIHDSSRHTLFSLSRANKALHELTLPFLYQVLHFDYTQADHRRYKDGLQDPYARSQRCISFIMENNPKVLQATRKIVVRSTYARWTGDTHHRTTFIPSDEDVESKWTLFVEFISRIVHLQDVVFDCRERVPFRLLDTLHCRHPSCRLHVRNWTRAGCEVRVGDLHEEALAKSPCLRSIEALVSPGPPATDLTFPAFHRILSLAPNLQSVCYSISIPKGWNYSLERMTPEQVENIQLETSRFEVKEPVKRGLKSVKWTSIDADALESFERAGLELETVESLDMGEVSSIAGLIDGRKPGRFTNLRHLTFTVEDSKCSESERKELKSKIVEFLVSIRPLQSLSITNYSSFVDLSHILRRHGDTLRSISLHEVESAHEPRSALTIEQLKNLRSMAPRLEEVELDINRTADGVKELSCYDLLGSFPELYRIKIYYDMGLCSSSGSTPNAAALPAYSRIDEAYGRGAWTAIQASKRKHGYVYRGIEELMLIVGEQRRSDGFWLGGMFTPDWKSLGQTLVLKVDERNDKRDEVHVVPAALS